MAGQWDAWIGREQRVQDALDQALATKWLATFDLNSQATHALHPSTRNLPRDHPGGRVEGVGGFGPLLALPQGIHLCLCTPDAPTSALGEDGHPHRDETPDSFLPPVPLPRRMWASSNMEFHAPIAVGANVERVSRIAEITEKSGGSGTLVFVKVAHDSNADGELAVREMQTLVYRAAAAADAPLSPPESGEASFDLCEWDGHRVVTPDPRLLFRYSALTFNTHRIHYDAPYARDVERYRGLVVHGPLTASLLLQLAARELGENRLTQFSFRGLSPAIADEPLHLVMRKSDNGPSNNFELAAFADDGRQVTKASAFI